MIPLQLNATLEKYNLKPIEFSEEGATFSVEDASKALNVEAGQIAKTILFKGKQGKYIMIVAAGDKKLLNLKIKEIAGGRVSMASFEETLEATGYPVGGVCPFGIMNENVQIFIDESLKPYDTVYTACGTTKSMLPVNYNILMDIATSSCDVT
ncbi:MAG: prolyl-tRNA synthetase [Alphaproteobacteria bacterium ADurb.Bin438]|nr:MAG: prolyl-tRNA synthetase [Alphaproteobacteria bacterium ADurb.Bin438]